MRSPTLPSLGLSVLLLALASTAGAQSEMGSAGKWRWLPEFCVLALDVGGASRSGIWDSGKSDEARWNRFYRLGIEAIETRDLEDAEINFCHALKAAESFAARDDIRFAETLDELGLVSYLVGDDERAEAMQGAAVAEMLLALGPPAEDLVETAEASCRSSVATYMVRLGWIFERQERGGEIDPLLRYPYRILGRGYVPWDSFLGRLDGLIAQYLLREDFVAADWLSSLRDRGR